MSTESSITRLKRQIILWENHTCSSAIPWSYSELLLLESRSNLFIFSLILAIVWSLLKRKKELKKNILLIIINAVFLLFKLPACKKVCVHGETVTLMKYSFRKRSWNVKDWRLQLLAHFATPGSPCDQRTKVSEQ